MDDNSKKGIFAPYSYSDPSMNVPVTAGPAGRIISPYMNFDPSYLQTGGESQFIYPEGANKNRGRFEKSFSQIGGAIIAGGALGGLFGLKTAFNDKTLKNQAFRIQKTMILNYVTKRGASTAQSFGVIALMYSLFGVGLWFVRNYQEDELNTFVAAGATGLLYKSSAGLNKCLRGGGVGLGLALAYYLYMYRENAFKM